MSLYKLKILRIISIIITLIGLFIMLHGLKEIGFIDGNFMDNKTFAIVYGAIVPLVGFVVGFMTATLIAVAHIR